MFKWSAGGIGGQVSLQKVQFKITLQLRWEAW